MKTITLNEVEVFLLTQLIEKDNEKLELELKNGEIEEEEFLEFLKINNSLLNIFK